MVSAIETWLESSVESTCDDMEETLTSPGRNEAYEFEKILEMERLRAPAVSLQGYRTSEQVYVPTTGENDFNGSRVFSKAKLAAVITRIAESGKEIYKTNLNKLLLGLSQIIRKKYYRGQDEEEQIK